MQMMILTGALVQHTGRQDGVDGARMAAVAVQQTRVLAQTWSLQTCAFYHSVMS